MEHICKFNKFGYCKYKNECKKNHVKEQCKDGQNCESVKLCTLRHPKMCKRIALEGHCSLVKSVHMATKEYPISLVWSMKMCMKM